MQRHAERCPVCSARRDADAELDSLLAADFAADQPEEAAALGRVSEVWRRTLADATDVAAPVRRTRRSQWGSPRRWMSASAALAGAVGIFVVVTLTRPTLALAKVESAMANVQVFHLRMEVPGMPARYEGWGEKGVGARLEEWEGDRMTGVYIDDGASLRFYDPVRKEIRQSGTRLKDLYRQAAGFNATRLLRQAARGTLFKGNELLGKATAREVARVKRNGIPQRRIQVELSGGLFERMIVYAELEPGRLTQANLYMDANSGDDAPSARVFFDYPGTVKPGLFQLQAPRGVRVRQQQGIPLPSQVE